MNDLDTLRTMRADVPPPSHDVLADARSRLLDRTGARSRWHPPRPRAGWQAAAAATIVVVLGVGAIVSTYERAGGPDDRVHASPSPTDTAQSVLARAAQTVARAPSASPATQGQYSYIKMVYRVIQPNVGANEDDMIAEFWFRIGGNVGALGRLHFEYETGDVLDMVRSNGQTVMTQNGQAVTERTLDLPKWFRDDPDPSAGWLPDDEVATAPTNAADMLDFVRGQFPFPGVEFDTLVGLLTQPILTSQQRAAAYEALAQLPDLSLLPDAVDATGRHGVGIVHDGPQRTTLILDADSYQLLGYERLMNFDAPEEMSDAPELQRGSGTAFAILDLGVTDRVDERP